MTSEMENWPVIRNWSKKFLTTALATSLLSLLVFCIFYSTTIYVSNRGLDVLSFESSSNAHGPSIVFGREMSAVTDTRYYRYISYGDAETYRNATGLHIQVLALTSSSGHHGQQRLLDGSARTRFSELGGSEFVDKLLNGRRGGVFVECGAGDGEYLSNSLFFELHRDWTGVLVEAEPNRRRALLAKNRHVRVVGACLSTSTSRPQSDLYRLVDVDAPGGTTSDTDVEVPCFRLSSITAALGVQHVDYLSVNAAEAGGGGGGAEVVDILAAVDWTGMTVDLMTVQYARDVDKLNRLRTMFVAARTFAEVGILPLGSTDEKGLHVVLMRIY